MIPFARVLTYNNKAPVPLFSSIIAISGMQNSGVAVLYDNGELYVCGNNRYGQLGLGTDASTNVMTLLDSGVTQLFRTDGTESNAMVYAKGNILYMCGKTAGWRALSTSEYYNVPTQITDITPLMTANSGVLFDGMVSDQNICLRIIKTISTNTLFISGLSNCTPTGSVTASAFAKVVDNVQSYSITTDGTARANLYYADMSGWVLGMGSNSNGQVSPSSIGQVYRSAYLMDSGSVTQVCGVGARVTYLAYDRIKGRGANAQNSLGAGSGNVTTAVSMFTGITPAQTSFSMNAQLRALPSATVLGVFNTVSYPGYGVGGKGIGGIGATQYLGSGSSGTVTTPVRYQNASTVNFLETSSNNCFFVQDNKLYCTVDSASFIVQKVDGENYYEFTMPYN